MKPSLVASLNRAYYIYWGMDAFFRAYLLKKKEFCLLLGKQMPFLIISNENIFFKIQGTRLGAIVVPNKGLE